MDILLTSLVGVIIIDRLNQIYPQATSTSSTGGSAMDSHAAESDQPPDSESNISEMMDTKGEQQQQQSQLIKDSTHQELTGSSYESTSGDRGQIPGEANDQINRKDKSTLEEHKDHSDEDPESHPQHQPYDEPHMDEGRELDVEEQIRLHLNEIERLRACQRQGQSQGQLPTFDRIISTSRSDVNRQLSICSQVRANRTVRSFPRHHQRRSSEILLPSVFDTNLLRRSPMKQLAQSDHSEGSEGDQVEEEEGVAHTTDDFISSIPHQNHNETLHESNKVDYVSQPRQTSLRRRSRKSPHHFHPDPMYSVVVSTPSSTSSTSSHLRSRSLQIPNLEHFDMGTVSGAESDPLEDARHTHTHAPLYTIPPSIQPHRASRLEPLSPLSPFRHNRTPSMSERLNVKILSQLSPSVPDHVLEHEHEHEHEDEHHDHDEEHIPSLHRIETAQVLPSIEFPHHSSASSSDHEHEDAEVHTAISTEQLADAIAAASSTVNCLQSSARTPSPLIRASPPRHSPPVPRTSATPTTNPSPTLRPQSDTSAKPPRSPLQPSTLTIPQSPLRPIPTEPVEPANDKPAFIRTRSLDGDELVDESATKSLWQKDPNSTPSMLRRSTTNLTKGSSSSATTATPTDATSNTTTATLHSPALSSAAWLERRMQKMFHPDDETFNLLSGATTDGQKSSWTQLIDFILSWLPSIFYTLIPCIILFQVLFLPMRLAFGSPQESGKAGANFDSLQKYDLPLDAIFLFGILFTDYLDISTLTLRPGLRKQGRFRPGLLLQVACDVISSLPYEFLTYFFAFESLWQDPTMATPIRLTTLIRLPRLLRLTRLFQYLDQFETRNLIHTFINPTVFRLFKLGSVMFIVAHLAGCGYVFLSYIEGCPEGNAWIIPAHIRNQSLSSQYLHAIYWGFVAMTGNGSGVETPQTVPEHLFALFVLLIGVSTYATLIGNLSGIIQQMNSKQEDFREKMTNVTGLMDTYKLPPDVQHRVKSCFQYLFNVSSSSQTDDDDSTPRAHGEGWEVLQFLPAYLRNEVLCHINGEIIHKVPLFRGCSDGFMRSLVPLLRPEVVIPGDYIIRTGEIGREMYLVRHGQLEVIAHGVVVATLSDGSYVGEVSIFFQQKRTASVRAITFCDILVLSKDDFDGVLSQYPEVQKSMRMQATMRRNARSLQDKEFRVAEIEKVNNASARTLPGMNGTTSSTTSATNSKPPTPITTSNTTVTADSQPRSDKKPPRSGGKTRITITPVDRTPNRVNTNSSAKSLLSPPLKSQESQSAKQLTPRRTQRAQSNVDESTAPTTKTMATSINASIIQPSTTAGRSNSTGETNVSEFDPSGTGSGATRPDFHRGHSSKWMKLRLLTRGQ